MKSYVKALVVVACLALSQTALARQVAVCFFHSDLVVPTQTIECRIGNDDKNKENTLFELTKAGWSIQALTPVQLRQERTDNYFSYVTYIYLEKP